MQKLVEHLRNAFDLVIFDTPPMLALPDAEILVPAADGVLLVHSPGKCAKEDVLEAMRVLYRAGAVILGIVVNNVNKKIKNITIAILILFCNIQMNINI